MSGGSEAYKVRRAIAPAFVMLYLIIATGASMYRGEELFPFFNWALFPSASNPKTDTVILVRSIDGKPLDRPTLFYDLPTRFAAARAKDSKLAKALDRLAWGVISHNRAFEQRVRATIEGTYLNDVQRMDYDLVILRYDPIERLHTGAIQKEWVLRSYRKGA